MSDGNHVPPFQYGNYSVEAWGHRSSTALGATEMVWSIRVDDKWLGSLTLPENVAGAEVVRRIKLWVTQNLPKGSV
jgi:hypothetical protein